MNWNEFDYADRRKAIKKILEDQDVLNNLVLYYRTFWICLKCSTLRQVGTCPTCKVSASDSGPHMVSAQYLLNLKNLWTCRTGFMVDQ